MRETSAPHDPDAREKWLDEILFLPQAAAIRGISVDTLKRMGKRGEVEILKLSARRKGVRRRVALQM